MSGGPQNATLTGEGFRFYRWEPAEGGEAVDLLSVTSIRKLCGEQYPLVNWQLGNLIDAAMGTVKRPKMGKRGKPLKNGYDYVAEEFPSEFVRRYLDSVVAVEDIDENGDEYMRDALSIEKANELRKWLREEADQPRNIAARRGTIVHAAIEKNIPWDRIERPWVEAEFMLLSAKDRAAAKGGVKDEDVLFVRDAVRQYWDMRANVPFIIVAREPQVFNLEMGYGGSADVLIWFLGTWVGDVFIPLPDIPGIMKRMPRTHLLTIEFILSIGGTLAVGDWKTSKGVYTDQVVQVHAYGAGEFIGGDGIKDERLTEILQHTSMGVLFHIRPTGWGVHGFEFSKPVFRAFAGSVAFARFLATYPRANDLFTFNRSGALPAETVEDTEEA